MGVVRTVVVDGVVVRTCIILMLNVAEEEYFSGVSLSIAIICKKISIIIWKIPPLTVAQK